MLFVDDLLGGKAMSLERHWTTRSRQLGRYVVPCCVILGTSAAAPVAAVKTGDHVPRVLILYPYDERLAATTAAGEAIRTRLLQATKARIDLFSEFLDLSRFPEAEHIGRMARYLSAKYADRRPDVVIALGEVSARFISANRRELAASAKIIVAGFSSSTAEEMDLPNDVVGAFSEFDIVKTAEMARGLQPEARHLFIIGGSSEFDRSWLSRARADLAAFSKDYETTYLEDLTIEEFTKVAAEVPRDSIILALTILKDRDGRNFMPREAVKQIAETAGAPIYGPYLTYIDYGVVGGSVVPPQFSPLPSSRSRAPLLPDCSSNAAAVRRRRPNPAIVSSKSFISTSPRPRARSRHPSRMNSTSPLVQFAAMPRRQRSFFGRRGLTSN